MAEKRCIWLSGDQKAKYSQAQVMQCPFVAAIGITQLYETLDFLLQMFQSLCDSNSYSSGLLFSTPSLHLQGACLWNHKLFPGISEAGRSVTLARLYSSSGHGSSAPSCLRFGEAWSA